MQVLFSIIEDIVKHRLHVCYSQPAAGCEPSLGPSKVQQQPKEFNKFYPCPLSFSFRLLPELDWLGAARLGARGAGRSARCAGLRAV